MTAKNPLILVINCGSSSLKFALFPSGQQEPLTSGIAEMLGQSEARIIFKLDGKKTTASLNGGAHREAMDALLTFFADHNWLSDVVAVGHRMVHGGEKFQASTLLTEELLQTAESLNHLAPLHNPANILGMRTAMEKLPGVPQAAVFDTAFHQTMPEEAFLYALPMRFYRDSGIRRYGFHGTSHRYIAEEAVRLFGLDPENHGIVIAHLGNGASATAVKNGKSMDTSMGLTPLEGLVMGTRSGDVDPGALIHLLTHHGYDSASLDKLLNKESGLLGLSEMDNDMRALEEAMGQGHEGATRAIKVFVHRLARYIGGLASSLHRFDLLVFTGGIGENSPVIRAMTLDRLAVFGLTTDVAANDGIFGGKSGIISNGGQTKAAVIPTNEEWMIAKDTEALIAGKQP